MILLYRTASPFTSFADVPTFISVLILLSKRGYVKQSNYKVLIFDENVPTFKLNYVLCRLLVSAVP
jgi:hypothetical protein